MCLNSLNMQYLVDRLSEIWWNVVAKNLTIAFFLCDAGETHILTVAVVWLVLQRVLSGLYEKVVSNE